METKMMGEALFPDPELETLLSWVSTPETAVAPPAQPLDWRRLVDLARARGLAPLLYRKLKSAPWLTAVPEESLRALHDAYYVSAARGIVLQRRLDELVGSLAQAGIRPVVLKGAALANSLYHDIAVRPMSDLDLLLRSDDVQQATGILESLGYVRVETEPDRPDPFASSFTGEVVFHRASSQSVTVELHWQLIPAVTLRKATRLDTDKIWQHTAPLPLERHQALQLTPEATLIHLCVHLSIHSFRHFWGLLDVALLSCEFDAARWARFADLAELFQVRTMAYVALTLVQRLFRVEIPSALLEQLAPSTVRQWLISRLLSPNDLGRSTGQLDMTTGQAYLLRFLLSDSLINSLRMLCWLWFPDRAWLQDRYGNEPRPLWRMRFTHLARLLSGAIGYSLSRRWASPARF